MTELIYVKCLEQYRKIIVQSLSHVQLFVTPWTAAYQASLSFTISRSLLKLIFTESVIPPNHLIFCHPLLLLHSVFPSISSKFICWNPKPKCDSIRRQAFGGWLDHEGGALQMGLIPLETSKRCLAFPEVRTWREESYLRRRTQTLARFWLCRHFGLGLPSLQNCEKEMFKPLGLWYSVAAAWMKQDPYSSFISCRGSLFTFQYCARAGLHQLGRADCVHLFQALFSHEMLVAWK